MVKKTKIKHAVELPTVAARMLGLRQSRVQAAIARGDIPTQQLAGGTIVVGLDDLRAFAANPPRRGPKKKAGSTSVE